MSAISVLSAPIFDSTAQRIAFDMPAGSTVQDVVTAALPGATARELDFVRVALVSDKGSVIIAQARWNRVKPRPGIRVVIRVVPGKDALRAILQIVVSIAAIALGQFWAAPLAGAIGVSTQVAQGVIALGVNVLGGLLINALIPPPKPSDNEQKPTFAITGWKNELRLDGIVPDVLGELRYAPPFGATSYTEIVGDFLYVRAVFNFGYGPLSMSDFRLGDTSLAEYDEFQTETRDGLPTDGPLTFYPRQVVEEPVGAELTRPKPRNDLGDVIAGDAIETPVIRVTGPDAKGASIIVGFPAGCVSIDKKGRSKTITVDFRIRQRLSGETEWQLVDTLSVTARKLEAFYRQYTWDFATRGRYEIEVTRMRPEDTSSSVQSRSSWVALQTLRPEYPFNLSKPLALVALRIKATHQLNSTLDSFNAYARRKCLDWDHETETWVERYTRNPAALFRYVLQSKANAWPVPDAGIDLPLLQEWHDFCRVKGLKYDRVIDFSTSFREVLAEIAGAGRARQRHDGVKWGVVIDRPQALELTDYISPRNAHQFSAGRAYVNPPHGVRVSFLDWTNDNKPAERLIPWPGHTGDIDITEQWPLPGKTDPDEVWRETRRRMYESIHRPNVYSVIQDGNARVATRGDRVAGSFPRIDKTQVASRVKSVTGNLVEIDELVTMKAGKDYAVRFHRYANDADQVGQSVLRTVVRMVGEGCTFTLSGDGYKPAAGDLIFFGEASTESFSLIVTGVEAGENFAGLYRLVDAAPIIDELTDAEVPPPWSGRIGDEIDNGLLYPPTPRFVSVSADQEDGYKIQLTIEPGSGPNLTTKFVVGHRISGSWTEVTFPAGNGGLTIAGYARNQIVELRGQALGIDGEPSGYAYVTIVIGASDAGIPAALDADEISVAPLLGGAVLMVSTTDDAATQQLQLYHSITGTVNRDTDAVGEPIAVAPSRSYSIPHGDTTRQNTLGNGGFDTSATWALGTDWAIGSGKATKTAGAASSITQPKTFGSGKFYRIAFTLSDVTAGNLTPRISGGSDRDHTARSANGSYSGRIQAVSGNNTYGFVASSDFAGSVDDAVLFLETSTCLEAGTHYYWIEPQTDEGVPGPLAGPFSVVIR